MTPPRLRTRLTLWFSASILLILLPVLAAVATLQWRSMREALDHHLREDLEFALEMLVVRDGAVVWRGDSDQDQGYDAGPRRWVEAYDAESRPRYLRGLPETVPIWRTLPDPATDPAFPYTTTTPAGAHVRILTTRRAIGDELLWVRVARSEDDLRADLRLLLVIFSVLGPIAVVVASAAGYVISGRTLTPLAVMAERARAISAERLGERLPVSNPDDELGQLAKVFNETFGRLEASFERLRRFTADVSHELRTPLTAIRSVGEVGLREARSIEDHQEVIGSMLEESDRLAHMVETLLTLSRWESGRVTACLEPVDVVEITRQVASQLAVLADERGVRLEVTPHGPMPLAGDGVMLRQAISNVIDNAVKFTPPGRGVTVGFSTTADEHVVLVDDEGPGIPADKRADVLERFVRLDRDRETGPDGAGLGLSIVQWAIAAHRGRVTIGDSPSGGTRVSITLPRA